MPDPPSTNYITSYVFENPWPLSLLLLVVAAVVGWRGLREGQARALAVAAVAACLAIAVYVTATLVTTSGEHARSVVRGMVDAAVEGDIAGVTAIFSDQATLHFERPENPGYAIESLRRAAGTLADSNRIEENTITLLRGYTVDADRAIVHLGCRTTTRNTRAPVASRWVLHVSRDGSGSWRVDRITCISIMGREPSPSLFRL